MGVAPRSVVWAVGCFGVSLLIGTGILGFAWGFPLEALVTFLAIGFLVFNSARRRNWARWTLTLVTIASLVITWSLIRFQLTYEATMGVATAIQICLELLGCCLLFLPQSGRWYRRT